jgi:hypothetical protein
MDKIRPLDLLAFSGHEIISKTIKVAEFLSSGDGHFSHVGLAVTTDILPPGTMVGDKELNLIAGQIYVFESGFSDTVVDVVSNKRAIGVQLRNLSEIMEKSSTTVAHCPLIDNPWNQLEDETLDELLARRNEIKDKFIKIFNDYQGRFYEMSVITMTATIIPFLRPVRDLKDYLYAGLMKLLHRFGIANEIRGPAEWQFCSELVTRVYQEYQIISIDIDPSNVVPTDFFGKDNDGIPNIVLEICYLT